MPSVEELLNSVLADDSQGNHVGGAAAHQAQELDLPGFVEELGKTASDLDKLAEALPSTPGMAAEQLRVLDNPMSLTRRQAHEQHKRFIRPALPGAASSVSVPTGLGDIQKKANSEETGSFLLSRLRSQGI